MSKIVQQQFELRGALAGKTITLGSHQFVDGVTTYTGSEEDAALVARFLYRNWQAVPVGADLGELQDKASDRLGEVDRGERNIQAKGPGVPGDLRPSGAQSVQKAAAVGEQPAGAEDGGQGPGADGSGQQAELNRKLQKAVLSLDPADDSHWTADGKPAMSAVEALYGATDITRADINAVAPGLTRKAAAKAKGA